MFQGPLGIWPYPLINLILSLAEKTAGKQGVSNVEEWAWVDSAGQKRVLTVHRKVE